MGYIVAGGIVMLCVLEDRMIMIRGVGVVSSMRLRMRVRGKGSTIEIGSRVRASRNSIWSN
jgi:hypothetical protein